MSGYHAQLQGAIKETLEAIIIRFKKTDTEIDNLRKRIESLERKPRQSFKQKLRERGQE